MARVRWGWVGWMGLACGCGSTTTPAGASSIPSCGESTFDAATVSPRSDAGTCVILASNYDQSCRVDADCNLVAQGDYCTQACLCRGAAINVSALPAFFADVNRVPSAADAMASMAPQGCMCIAPAGPCCRSGVCQVGARCADSGSCQ